MRVMRLMSAVMSVMRLAASNAGRSHAWPDWRATQRRRRYAVLAEPDVGRAGQLLWYQTAPSFT